MITRRTARFAQLAHSVEDTSHQLGVEPDPAAVDQALNDQTQVVAAQLGISHGQRSATRPTTCPST